MARLKSMRDLFYEYMNESYGVHWRLKCSDLEKDALYSAFACGLSTGVGCSQNKGRREKEAIMRIVVAYIKELKEQMDEEESGA